MLRSEAELVGRAVGGEREAFSDLLRLHDQTMRTAATRIVGRHGLVDDALQDAYVRAYRSIGGFRADGPFAAWLRRIVVNCCIDHVRQLARRSEESIDREPAMVAESPSVDGIVDAGQLYQALHDLPADQRVALVLIEWEGYSYNEVAAMTESTPGTVGSRLSRARASLRAVLEQP